MNRGLNYSSKIKRTILRGSIFYQSSLLVKQIFQHGAKKIDRIDPNSDSYQKTASFKTAETYRTVWENFFKHLQENYQIKNFENIESWHVEDYMYTKIDSDISEQYLEKISSALGKLELALTKFTFNIHGIEKAYDFSIRQSILNEAREDFLLSDNYRNRAYKNPNNVIKNLINPLHKLAAKIQLESGTRIEGVALIKENQRIGKKIDVVTNEKIGVFWTQEKGGKQGAIAMSLDTYEELKQYLFKNDVFKIDRQSYYRDIRQAALKSNEISEASHGFRWNFAQNRMIEYAKAGYSYEESLQSVSNEMKHNRSSITKHYTSNFL